MGLNNGFEYNTLKYNGFKMCLKLLNYGENNQHDKVASAQLCRSFIIINPNNIMVINLKNSI